MNTIITQNLVLQNEKLLLRPFESREDFEYLFTLISKYKHNRIPKGMMRTVLNQYGHLFWTLYTGNTKVGVVYTCYMPELGFTIDGYRNNKTVRKLKSKISYSFEALKLVTDYMLNNITNILWTTHDIRNRGATIMCLRYKYKIEKEINTIFGKFALMSRRKL